MAAPALSLDLSGIAVDQPEVPEPIANALSNIQTTINDLGNVHIADDAAIETSKLELGSGSATAAIMNNNVAYKGKNAAGTAKDLLKLGTDDYLRLSQLVEQDVAAGVTTNNIRENQLLLRGWNYVVGSGGATTDLTITLPVTLSNANYDVALVYLGCKAAGGNWANRQGGDSDPEAITVYRMPGGTFSTTAFQIRFRSTTTMNAAKTYGVSWIILGTKS